VRNNEELKEEISALRSQNTTLHEMIMERENEVNQYDLKFFDQAWSSVEDAMFHRRSLQQCNARWKKKVAELEKKLAESLSKKEEK